MAKANIEIQNLTRSCNELLIMGSLVSGRKHGYEIAILLEEKSEGQFRFNHGTLYPILHNLEKKGLIKGEWKQEVSRRKRKYYSLTSRGRRFADSRLKAWHEFSDRFFTIAGELEQ